jgi:deoxycytidine triphosphate deaminase
MKELFRHRKWGDIQKKCGNEKSFIIDPFDPLNLTPFSYDLKIGDEAFSCMSESHGSFRLSRDEKSAYWMLPGETVIIRTDEYIALPPCYSATVWPRFNFVREGIFQSMVKIDPTWYGKLGIALTNLSPTEYPIWMGREFATLVLYELTSSTDITLYRSGEILNESEQVEVPLGGIEIKGWESKIKEKGLEGKCIIQDDNLVIKIALKPEEFKKLMQIDDRENWTKAIEKSMRMKTMGALGLPELDLILEKDPKGKRIKREKIASEKCTEEALTKAAVERGKPFDLVANLPKLVPFPVIELRVLREIL